MLCPAVGHNLRIGKLRLSITGSPLSGGGCKAIEKWGASLQSRRGTERSALLVDSENTVPRDDALSSAA